MRFARLLVVLLVSMSSAVAAAQQPSGAQITEARREFELGTSAYDAGRFDEALERFRRAYDLTDSPDLIYNIATVLDRLRRDEEALAAYEQFLAARPDSADRANIEARVQMMRVSIERARLERESGEPVVVTPVATEAPVDRSAPPPAVMIEEPRASDPVGGFVLIGTGAVLAAGGIALLVVTALDISTVENGTSWAEIRDAHDRVPILSTIGFISLGVGVAAAIAGVIWVALPGDSRGPRARLGVGPSSITIAGDF